MSFMKKNILFHFVLIFYLVILATQVKAEKVDYGLYTSLLMDYNTAYGTADFKEYDIDKENPYYENFGVLYTRLIDFNSDGIPELVIVRVDEETQDYTNAMQIYGFDIDGRLLRLAEFTPYITAYEKENYNVVHADYYGDTYLFTGYEGKDSEQTVWKLTYSGFVREIDFKKETSNDQINYFINANKVTEEEFNKKLYEYSEHKIIDEVSGLSSSRFMLLMERNMASIASANLPAPTNGKTPTAVFNDSQFVIYEDVAESDEEQTVRKYFNAKVTNNLTTLSHLLHNFSFENEKATIERKSYIPGFVIEDITTLTEPIAAHSLYLNEWFVSQPNIIDFYEQISPTLKTEFSDYKIIQCTVNEVKDFSHTQHAPQIGYGTYRYWFYLVKMADTSVWKIYDIYSDHFIEYGGYDNPFKVKFIGYKSEGDIALLSKAYSYVDPRGKREISRLNIEGDETYLISPTRGDVSFTVYEFPESDDPSMAANIIYKTKPGEHLLVSTNLKDTRPALAIQMMEESTKFIFLYLPFLDQTRMNEAALGEYAEELTERYEREVGTPSQIVACGKSEGWVHGNGLYLSLENIGTFFINNYDDNGILESKVGDRICIAYKTEFILFPDSDEDEEFEMNIYERILSEKEILK